MKFYRKIAYLLVILCFTSGFAQNGTCTAIVQQALAEVQQGCAPTGRNQACYGYVSLQATPRDGVQNFTFAQQGDLADVADIDTLRLSALNTAANTWGIALMKLQANLPDTLPGQNVTFLLFGDVQIQNDASATSGATVQVTSKANANIRSEPSTNGSMIGLLAVGDQTDANGRNQDGTWLRIQIPDGDALGWVSASLLTTADDINTLSVVDSTDAPTSYKPMQAFYFSTGITQTSCAEAPADGILIQTPQGVGQINLRANDVDITLGSTAFLQAQANANLTVSVVEGEGHVTSNGETVNVPAGAQVSVPMDANLQAAGAPSDPVPYDTTLVNPLPVQDLPEPITIAPPASAAEILAANAAPTPPPPATSTGGASSFNIPGLNSNLGDLTSMGTAQFCQYMATAFAEAGMSKSQYLAQMQQMVSFLPPDVQGQFQTFVQMITQCP